MMNPTKFGYPYLDTPSSRYEFLKFVTKSVKKINKEKSNFISAATARCTCCIHPAVTNDWAQWSTRPHVTERLSRAPA